jgi:multidrug resistance efflux pump
MKTLLLVLLLSVLQACGDGRAARAQSAPADGPPAGPVVVAMARGIVELPGGLTELTAAQDGVVASVAVQEGETVRAGQVLLRLSDEQQQQDLALARAELQVAQARELGAQARLPAAQSLAQRLAEAARAEAVDRQRADDAAQGLSELQASARIARAETAVAQQKLTQVQAQARRLVLSAPHDGSVLRLQVRPGMRVLTQGGKPLVTLLPVRALRLRAEVNEAYASRIVPGMRARLRLDGDDAASTALPGARVVRLAPMFGGSRLDDEQQARGNLRVVDCFLEFDQAPALRIGQSLRVEFHE